MDWETLERVMVKRRITSTTLSQRIRCRALRKACLEPSIGKYRGS
jgi:hypothetical protein